MKAILISIRPQYVAKILNGEKTIEIRKKFPKDYVGGVYIYCTKNRKKGLVHHIKCASNDYGWDEDFVEFEEIPIDRVWSGCELNGKVVARFWCDKVDDYVYGHKWSWENGAPMWGAENSYENILKDACLTDEELRNYVEDLCFSAIHINDLEIFDKPKELSEFSIKVFPHRKDNLMTRYLTRAPQSWQFIEI